MDKDIVDVIIRVAIACGIVAAVWQFNRSMERIADALTKIANLKDDSGSVSK
jgi:hypothetical protein